MKYFLCYIFFLLGWWQVVGQNDFTGIAKYKLTVEGSDNPVTDSMSVIFSKQKVEVILYLPDLTTTSRISEKIFIDDFKTKTIITLNTENKTYKTDTLNTIPKYEFTNTNKIAAGNNMLCFRYTVDSTKIDTSLLRVECLASIDYRNSFISNYFFLGIQPIIIDNRIVMDYITTKIGGGKQRIYVTDIKKMENVESYFNLSGYKQEK